MEKNLYIKTFGCQMNERDSEIIEQLFSQEGYLSVATAQEANVIILNTCSIRDKAEQKVYSLLGQLREQKQKQPDLCVGVAGCVAQQEGEQIFKRMPHVDFVVGTQQFYQLPEMVHRLRSSQTKHEQSTLLEKSFVIPPFQKLLTRQVNDAAGSGDKLKRFVTIMQGCNNFCSYCVVPYTRGREISRPVSDIVEEVEILVSQGVKEITLLGQNVNSYGMTNAVADHDVSFAQLLRKVAAVSGLQRLRFTTSNPKDLSDELMRCFADLENLCPHFHLPVQSGSDRILKLMNRKYTISEYLQKVETLKVYNPDIAMATDMIIGFPGETDEDFKYTMELLETVRFHGSFSFKYSDRPNTRSASFDNKVSESVKSERLRIFQSRQDEISLERNKEYIDKKVEVMVEAITDTQVKGRAATNHVVHFDRPQTDLSPGDCTTVVIHHAGKHSLKGKIAE